MDSKAAHLSSHLHSNKHSTYFSVYDDLLSAYVGGQVTLVEVGVWHGGSLFMWREILGPQARIIGIDINPNAKTLEQEGFEIFIGDQADQGFWDDFFKEVGPVDVVVDDGGHRFEQQIVTTLACLPHINDGGVLIVEDTHSNYLPEFGGPSDHSFMAFAKDMIDGINFRFSEIVAHREAEQVVHSMSFHESIVAFQVDRQRCALKSEIAPNGGEPQPDSYFDSTDGAHTGAAHVLARAFPALSRMVFSIRRRLLHRRLRRYFRFK
jgi:hypothetical protein